MSTPHHGYRSIQLNKYYWGVVIPHAQSALEDAGWEREMTRNPELVHDFFKKVLHVETTSKLTNKEFNNYIEDIKRICATYLRYYIPDANE